MVYSGFTFGQATRRVTVLKLNPCLQPAERVFRPTAILITSDMDHSRLTSRSVPSSGSS